MNAAGGWERGEGGSTKCAIRQHVAPIKHEALITTDVVMPCALAAKECFVQKSFCTTKISSSTTYLRCPTRRPLLC